MEQRPLYAVVDYEAKVGDSVFAVPFPYIEKAHVFVYVDDYPVNFTWLSDNSVQLQFPLPEDATVRVRRQTPLDRRLVDFQSASVLTEKDLDVSNLQVFFNQQEVEDDLYLGLLGYDVSNLKGANGDYIEQRFMWAVEAPDTPIPFDPQPFGWLPAIPEEPENNDPLIQYHLWMTQCWKDGASGQCQTIWSRPVRLTGNDAERLDLKDGWIRREHFEAELAAQIELDYTALNAATGLAESARDIAQQAASDAQAAQDSASQAQETATQAVADATQALDDANTLKADAQAAAQTALEQAGLADAARGAAVVAATDAEGYAQAAVVSKNPVQDQEEGIKAAAQAAALAATDAEGNAMAALTAKTDAVQAKDEAILAADAAVVAKTDAEGNASAALAASTEAKTYRDQAKTNADAAVLAKTDAEGSAEAALVAKTTVETLKGQVETDAQAAATAKTDAEGAATAALTAKSEATDAATNASTSAQAAATAATTAEGHAQAALTAKTDAENSAEAAVLAETNAEGHAQAALTAKTDAEDAAQAAVLAKTDAEGNATSALTARTQAQGHADDAAASASSAATDAQAAIQAKTDAEGYASSALVAKSEAEDAANAAKTDAIAAAQSKADAEGNASASLVAQTNAENAQAAAENARDAAVNAKNAAVTAQTASVQAKTDAEGHASAALTAQSEASNYSADALAYRNTSKTYRDQALSYRDSASDSAAIATSQANAAIQAKTEAGESAELVSQVSLVQGIIMDFWEGNVGIGLADDYASATSKFTLTSDSEGKAALRIQLVDAEGGGVIAFNGEIIDQGFRGADNEVKWYEYVVDAKLGDNEVAIWRSNSDGISLRRIELRGGDQDTKFNAVEERLRANEDEAFYSLKVQYDGKVAGIGAIADPLGTALLFQADQIGFTHDAGEDIFPFTIRDNIVYMDKARMVTMEANSIVNVESVYNTERKAVLGNTLVEGDLTLALPEQIQWRDLDREFRDRLVLRSKSATLTGGTRNASKVLSEIGEDEFYTLYAAQEGNPDNPPILSGGKLSQVTVDIHHRHGTERRKPAGKPKVWFKVARQKLGGDVNDFELIADETIEGNIATDQYLHWWSSLSFQKTYTTPLPEAGGEYIYWVSILNVENFEGNAELVVEAHEEVGSSDGLVVNTEWGLILEKPETATRWPTWNEVSGKPIMPAVNYTVTRTFLQDSATLNSGFYTTSQGLPNPDNSGTEESSWWHVLHFKHGHENGYAAQLALELSSGTDAKLQFRTSGGNSNGDSWTNWYKVYSEQHKPTWNEVTGKPDVYSSSNKQDHIPNLGSVDSMPTGRNVLSTGIHTYGTRNTTTNAPHSSKYGESIVWGEGDKGAIELWGGWVSGGWGKLYTRALRDTTDNWSDWYEVYTSREPRMRAILGVNTYTGLAAPDGNDGNWIRTTVNGFIPYQSGGASSLGTSSWPFNNIYGKVLHGNEVSLDSTEDEKVILRNRDDNWNYILFTRADGTRAWETGVKGGSSNNVYTFRGKATDGSYDSFRDILQLNYNDDRVYANNLTVSGSHGRTVIQASGTIAGAAFNEGWLQVGDSANGWSIDPNEIYCSGTGIIGTLSGDLNLNPSGQVQIKNGVKLNSAASDVLQISNSNGWVRVGANNTGYAHFYTDRPWFYMDKGLQVKGNIKVYNSQSQLTSSDLLVGANGNNYSRLKATGSIAKRSAGWEANSVEREILTTSWTGNIGDYIQLHATGNRGNNGALVIARDVFAVGTGDYGVPDGAATTPLAVDNWMAVNTTDFFLSGKRVFRHSDSWLRLNEDKSFSSGIYCGGSTLRTDGLLQVGSSGNAFNASTSQIDLKVTTRVHNRLHAREIVSQDGNFTTIGAGELGNSLRSHVTDTHGTGNEGLHLGGEHGVYLYSHPNNMSGGMAAGYSIRVLASDGASYLNHLDVYKTQNNASQVVARFRHPSQNTNVAIVAKNQDKGSFRLEANADGGDLRIQTAGTNGGYLAGNGNVGTIAYFYRSGNVKVTGRVTAADHIATSDRRVKDKLEVIEGAMDKLDALTGYTYDHLTINERKAGLIAQDVEKVLPEAVTEDDEGIKQVSPWAVIGLLVNAIKELKEEVRNIKNGNV